MKQILQSSLWAHRDVRLVLPARALSYAGDAIAMVALMLRVKEYGGTGAITVLLLAFAVPTVVMIPVAGRIVDSYDSRAVLVWATALQAVAGVALAFSHDLVSTVGLVCLLQVGQAIAGPCWGALIPRIVGEGLVGRAIGVSQALIGVAMLVGSAVGGVLVEWIGGRDALLVDAATFGVLTVVAGLVRTRRRPALGAVKESGGFSAGLRTLLGDPLLRVLVVCLWVFVVVGEAVNVVEVFLVIDEVGLNAAGYGWVLAAQGAGAILGAWGSGRLTTSAHRARAVLAGVAGIGLGMVGMGAASGVVLLVLGAVITGAGGGLLNAASSTLIVTRVAEAVRGRVVAALSGTVRACSLVALPLGGLLGGVFGPRATFLGCGVLCVVGAMGAALLVARTKDSAEEVVSH
ncbi:MFS transporter [Kribbella antibiotica]|uniref:MFS transporter n=1 Tax=Kribbella antibiotica TaxID=190195 RepID=A0A4R4ZV44_9ACTN|nr:MFS transporter [Kribbella antibiotica]TDD63048.1 MFS transporter [Kribbella antibiotica]